jgi:uncharacterized protein YjbJ (UPF0337 family)
VGEAKDKVQGTGMELGGKVTGNRRMEIEGKAQKAKGKVEETVRELVDEPAHEPTEPERPN